MDFPLDRTPRQDPPDDASARRSRRDAAPPRRPSASPPREPPRKTRAQAPTERETIARIGVAVPWIALAIFIVAVGGIPFALAMIGFAMIGLGGVLPHDAPLPADVPVAFAAAAAMVVAAYYGGQFQIVHRARRGVSGDVPVRRRAAGSREGDHASRSRSPLLGDRLDRRPVRPRRAPARAAAHGGALVIDVLVAHLPHRHRRLRRAAACSAATGWPRSLSPNKTLEGLAFGLRRRHARLLVRGPLPGLAAGHRRADHGHVHRGRRPVGDLFESMIKRDLEIKDTGNVFGPHGGLLDRLDARPVHDRRRLLPGGRVRLLSDCRDRRATNSRSARRPSGSRGVSHDHRRAGLSRPRGSSLRRTSMSICPLAEALVAVGAGAGRVAGVVGVQEVDLAGDREHPLDGRRRAPRRRRARGRCRSRSRGRSRGPRPRSPGPRAGPARRSAARRRCRRRPCSRGGRWRRSRASRASAPAAGALGDVVLGVAPGGRSPPSRRRSAAASQVCWRILRDP